ncbi:FMN-dependent NADH-azoreductase [Vagococcus sp.]|uniref:FMN-dependent NADH-azoreductase n=1 Tax=Vagococcus sp. TaxID=1933889 RepID=UPI002FCC2541
MKTLIINSHPDFTNKNSFSVAFQETFIQHFKEVFPTQEPTILNLYDNQIPAIKKDELLAIWEKQQTQGILTPEEKYIETLSNTLLEQFKEHHRIVIVTPLHNFNVESRLKDYLDNILIAKETFKYTEDGSVGLMTDDYKVLMIQASGSIYTNKDRYTSLDISHLFIKGIFQEIMGFDDFYKIRLQGTAILNSEDIIEKGINDLEEVFPLFYS